MTKIKTPGAVDTELPDSIESSLLASSEIFKKVMDSLDAIVYVADIKTHEIIFSNKYLQETIGAREGQICWQAIQKNQSGPCEFCPNDLLLNQEGEPGDLHRWEHLNPLDGRWYDMIDRAINWIDGRLVRVTIATDITDRKQMEDSLKESNEKLNTLLKTSPDLIKVIDSHFNIVYTNEIIKDAVPRDYLGTSALGTVDSVYHQQFKKRLKEVVRNRETQSYEFRDVHGKWWESQIAAISIGSDSNGAMLITRDISERKQMEKSLIESNEKLNTLLKNSPDFIYVIDDDLNIIYTNEIVKNITSREILGSNILRKVHSKNKRFFKGKVSEVINKRISQSHEFEDIHTKWREAEIAPITIGSNSRCAMLIIRDISDRKQAESLMQQAQVDLEYRVKERTAELNQAYDQLIQSEKMATLGFLISGIAHEINNPNSFISFNIPILRDYLAEMLPVLDDYANNRNSFEICGMEYPEFREDIMKMLENIEHGSQRITKTVSNLKEYVRPINQEDFQIIDPKEVIGIGIELCRNKVNKLVKRFEVDIPDNLPKIKTIAQSLEQILINLLINAAQAADKPDSRVKITAVQSADDSDILCIDVHDNGCGIKKVDLEKIFEPFYSTKDRKSGVGLGLNITKKLAEEIGGTIEVESEHGVGSRFRLKVPVGF